MINLQDIVICGKIVDDLPAGLLVIDPEGVIVKSNQAASRLLDIPLSNIIGRGWGDLFFGRPENDKFNQLFLDVIQEEPHSLSREVVFTTDSNKDVRLSVQTSFVQHEKTMVGIIVLLNDVTDLYRAKESERMLLLERNRQQEERIKGLTLLSQSIAHQVRNPVSVIGGFSKRLKSTMEKCGFVSEYPDIILEQAVKLGSIVDGITRLASAHKIDVANVDVRPIIEHALALAKDRATSQGKFLSPTVLIGSDIVYADKSLLAKVLVELLSNSIDFSDGAVVDVVIKTELVDCSIMLSVSDKGQGIAQEKLPFVFDPFFTTKSSGVGLGLTIARQAILEHGGRVGVVSKPDVDGTVVELLLPGFNSIMADSLQEAGDD
jgi:PAS domain S-box-containing protein